jgi:hypothetical protein
MSEPEWGPEFHEAFGKTALGRAIGDMKAVLAEHRDDNAPTWIVTPQSGDPEELKRAAKVGTFLNNPKTVEAIRRAHVRRMLYGY